ncbi:MAG: hypothetical protein HOP15_00105, partial [Planctomycetes bacterium]|nr:hypothetical protein [Planctomycetota bacterium]
MLKKQGIETPPREPRRATRQQAAGERERGPRGKWRSIWISDVHLGTRTCRADLLLHFLNLYSSEYLYLVGD